MGKAAQAPKQNARNKMAPKKAADATRTIAKAPKGK